MMCVVRRILLALSLCGVMLARCEDEPVTEDPEVMLLQSRTARFAGISKGGAAVAPGRLDQKGRAAADLMDTDLTAEDEDEMEHDDHDVHDEDDEHDEHEDHGEDASVHHEDDMARIMRVARLADTKWR